MKGALKSISYIWFGSLIGALFSFVTHALLARMLTKQSYGEFSFFLSIISVLAPFAGFGLSQFMLSVFSSGHEQPRYWLKPIIIYMCSSVLAIYVIVVLATYFLDVWSGQEKSFLLLLSIIAMQALIEISSACAQIQGRYSYYAIINLSQHFLRFIPIVFLFVLGVNVDVFEVTLIYAIVALVIIFYLGRELAWIYVRGFSLDVIKKSKTSATSDKDLSVHYCSIKKLIKKSAPYGLSGIFFLIYYQIALIATGTMISKEAAGSYNIAFLIVSAIYLFPTAVYQKFLQPKIHQAFAISNDAVKYIYIEFNKYTLSIGLIAGGVLWGASDYVVEILFGAKYLGASDILKVLCMAVPIKFATSGIGVVLSHKSHIWFKTISMGVVAIMAIIFQVYFIGNYGGVGAAYAIVLTEACLLLIFLIKLRKVLS